MSSAPPLRRRPPGRSILLHGVDWRTYGRLLKIFADRPGLRLTYDRGALEIMSPLREHESVAEILGCFVRVLAEELNVPIGAGRSTTLRRRKKQRGLEPDHSWWIQNEIRVRGKTDIDFRVDPPPDLAIEVDVTRSSPNRMSIYAALGVQEIWRDDKGALTFHLLQSDGTYAVIPRSQALPLVTPADLARFLALRTTLDETSLVRQFRAWVRQQLAGGTPPAP